MEEDAVKDFSPGLTAEVAKALGGFLASEDDMSRMRLKRATNSVCTEAHQLQLTPEQLVAALRRLFERAPVLGAVDGDRRQVALEQFMQGCIAAYYDADDPPARRS